jgi:hypothetical protein
MIPSVGIPLRALHVTCQRLSLLLLCCAVVSGCALDKSYRPYSAGGKPEVCENSCTGTASDPEETCATTCTGTSPAENRSFHNFDANWKEVSRGNYLVGYVEFDDQGWFQDGSQRKAIFDAVAEDRKAYPDHQYLIVVFAHGWKHNARGEDSNVEEFNKLLERLDVQEQLIAASAASKRKPRKVVGIYLGWRGASLTVPYLENITFWNRKNAGERVGDRSAKQLLMEINNLRANLNGWSESDKLASSNETQLILIGHSFGGLLMYHALHTELMDRELHLERGRGAEYRLATAKSFGDFILLVNPAFEGSAYEPLFVAAQSRCFFRNQRPIMAVVTSKSDWATKYAFPIGRLYTLLQTAPHDGERSTVMKTVGHLPRYITHDIQYVPDRQEVPLERTEGLSTTTVLQARQSLRELARPQEPSGKLQGRYGGVSLTPTPVYAGRDYFPYLVMSADKNLIKDHNDIWNDRFIQFITSFITKEIMSKDGSAPGDGPFPQPNRFWEQDGKQCR